MDKYEKLKHLGQGAHGIVVQARVRSVVEVKEDRKQQRIQRQQEEQQIASTAAATSSSVPSTTGTPGRKRKFDSDVIDVDAESDSDDEELQLPAPADTIVAIKKIRVKEAGSGFSLEAIREFKFMQELAHPNILRLFEVFNHHHNVNLVLEYATGDMFDFMQDRARNSKPLSAADIKAYMKMMLAGIEHCHKNWIMHRDLKPGNLLLATDGSLRIADFGLAKIFGSPDRRMSPQACTLWYRAPELLFGATSYGSAADMWSIGCIMGELFWLKPMFAGPESELAQLQRICALLGTPNENDWPGVRSLRNYLAFKPQSGHSIKEMFPAITDDAADLLAALLTFNPAKRITATEALAHRYFRENPLPTPVHALPKFSKADAKAAAAVAAAAAKPVIDRAGKASGKMLNFDSP